MLFGERSLGSAGASAGVTRDDGPGSDASGADDRIVMTLAPLFTGRTKLPVNVAPASSTIVSPGSAAFSAAWKSPPALTVHTVPAAGGGGGGGGAGGAGGGVTATTST